MGMYYQYISKITKIFLVCFCIPGITHLSRHVKGLILTFVPYFWQRY